MAQSTVVMRIIESLTDYRGNFAVGIEDYDENDDYFNYALFPIIVINLPVNCVSKGTNK